MLLLFAVSISATRKLTINSADEFKTQVFQKRENSEETGPLAIAARVGGSTVDFAIKGVFKDKEPLHVNIKINPDNKYQALKTLFDIFAFVSFQAKNLGQNVLPIDMGIAGFTTTKHQDLFVEDGKNLPHIPGLHILANYKFNKPLVANRMEHPRKNNLICFITELNRAFMNSGIQIPVVEYQDENGTRNFPVGVDQSSEGFKVSFKVINDTVAIGNSVLSEMKDNENVLTMVGGSGFNVGKLLNFSKHEGRFKKLINTEVGHKRESLTEHILSDFNEKFLRDYESKMTPDWLYAAGPSDEKEARGLVAYVESFKDNGTDVFSKTSLNCLEKIDSKAIVRAAKEGDTFALGRLCEYASSLGKFLNENFTEIIKDPNTKKLVITGSHILDILSISIVRNAFETELNNKRAENLDLVELAKDKVDGMLDLVQARAIAVKLAA